MKKFYSRLFFLSILCLTNSSYAVDSATRVVVTVENSGYKKITFMYPINANKKFEFKADEISQILEHDKDVAIRARGNAQISVRNEDASFSTIYGDDILLKYEKISIEMSNAINDLEAMEAIDQEYRSKQQSEKNKDSQLDFLQEKNDSRNIKRLTEIISKFGWPSIKFAGAKGSSNAFLVLQHADLVLQKKFVPLLRNAVAENDARGDQLALLEDRILISDGLPQLYGTQFESMIPLKLYPIEDEKNLDDRRKKVGLQPIKEYIQLIEKSINKQ